MKEITLNAAALKKLFAIWNLPLPDSRLVLFGLRGCRPLSPAKSWAFTVKVKSAPLDYRHLRCTVGIWDQKSSRIFIALGSTVPHQDYVLAASRKKGSMKGRGTNQMEPGLYSDLRKGEHLQGKPRGHSALRQTGYRFYRRSHHAPPITRRDPLYFSNPHDNLHCSWNLDGESPGFRSSGCLVIAGLPHCPRIPESTPNLGDWKTFHELLYGVSQKNFPFLLLPATEAGRVLKSPRNPPRLCFGSRGEAVKQLQEKLRRKKLYPGTVNGIMDPATYRAWNRAGLAGYGKLMPG